MPFVVYQDHFELLGLIRDTTEILLLQGLNALWAIWTTQIYNWQGLYLGQSSPPPSLCIF